MCYSFYYTSYRTHRDLHSFPTRRSSDLLVNPSGSDNSDNVTTSPTVSVDADVDWGFATAEVSSEAPRSEEHTSELQSRGHLVCRLLLEKKNIRLQTY